MSMVKFILPLLALPLGEGAAPFVSADWFKGGAVKGIHLRNIANRHAGQIQIGIANPNPNLYSNQVHYLNATAPTGNDHYFGYWFENCDNLEVDNNIALSNTVPLGNGIDKRFRGFSVDNTTNSNFCSNKAEQMGSGVWVYNKCAGTFFKGTNTTGNWHNFHLANADFPWQDGTGHDLNNAWTNAGSTFDFAGSLAGAVAILKWYTSDYLTTTKEGGLGLQALSIIDQTSGYSNDCQTAQAPADDKRKEYFGRAVTDTTDYGEDFAEENKYQDKEAFYKAALKDSTILKLGLPDDVVFQNTFDSLSQTNIAAIAGVKQLLDSDNVASALAVNSTIAPSNIIETNSKATHQLLAAYIQNDSLTTAQKEDAHSIGVQTALEGGLDVYTMRALLNEDIVDDIDASANLRRAHHTDDVKKESVKNMDKLYPNPSANSVTFASKVEFSNDDVLTVYDLLQQTIAEYKLVAKSTNYSFDISWLQQSVYYVKHIRGSTIVSENKLVVIR